MRAWWFVVLAGCGRFGFDSDAVDARPSVDDAGNSLYRKAVTDDSPVAYWRLGEASGIQAHDEIGNEHGTWSGTFQRVPGATNDGDLAVKLDGASARCEVGDVFAFAGTAQHTIELWAMRDVANDHAEWMIDRSTIAMPQDGWQVYTGDDFTLYSRVTADSEHGFAGSTELSPGVWRYIVATYDGADSAMYIDGELVGGMRADPIVGGVGSLVFGDRVEEQFFKFDGTLDEIAVYDHVLSPARIRAHYEATGR